MVFGGFEFNFSFASIPLSKSTRCHIQYFAGCQNGIVLYVYFRNTILTWKM